MKASELIEILKGLLESGGDMNVRLVFDRGCDSAEIGFVKVGSIEDGPLEIEVWTDQ